MFARYQELQRELERNPSEFLGRRFHDLLAEARGALAGFVGARPEDLVFVPNATAGLNAVIRSLRFGPEDEVLTTRHEYGAVTRTWEFMGAKLVYAEPGELAGAIGPRTKAVSVSHITSPTALVLPVEEICAAARAAGVLSIVDGAHAPGQLPLDLERLGADIYAGNCHKWLCAPKGAAFLWAQARAPAVDRAARDLVGLRRRGELRRAARLAGHARSGGVPGSAGGDRGPP